MIFRYEAFSADSKPKTGAVEADTQEDATSKIRNMGLFIMKVEEFSDGKPIRTVLNHEPERQPEQPAEPKADGVVFDDFLAEASQCSKDHQAPFSKEELHAIRDRAMYWTTWHKARHDIVLFWAHVDLMTAVNHLDAQIDLVKRGEEFRNSQGHG